MSDGRLLTPTEVGDALDLEDEATYPCSDGSLTTIVSVDKLIEKQDAKTASIKDKEWLKALNQAKDATSLSLQVKDAECYQRVTAVEETLEKLHLEAQEQWMDSLLQKDAECQEKIDQIVKDDADRCAQYLKAERASCQERVERIFREIEKQFFGEGMQTSFAIGLWQAFKKKEEK